MKRKLFWTLWTLLAAACLLGVSAGGAAQQATAVPALEAPGAPFSSRPDATLAQLMRGMMYPESNVLFAAQYDVGHLPVVDQPAISPNPLTSAFGGWQAVENNALALAESAQLLVTPGRVCSNGKPVPVDKADWVRFAHRMHDTALQAYAAAQTKNSDNMVDTTGAVADACFACHSVYRSDRSPGPGRCVAATPAAPPAKPPA